VEPDQRADLEHHLAEVQRDIGAGLCGNLPLAYPIKALRERRAIWWQLGQDDTTLQID
jgi:hypothetical protein